MSKAIDTLMEAMEVAKTGPSPREWLPVPGRSSTESGRDS